MKKQSLIFGLIFALFGFSAEAQIFEMYHQGFETSETNNYTVTGSHEVQTAYHNGGSRALKMTHNSDGTVVLELDVVDLSNNSQLQYVSLEFDHICTVHPINSTSATNVAILQVKRPDQTTWTRLNNQHYNKASGVFSSDFADGPGSFSNQSYPEWKGSNTANPTATVTPNNAWWKHERFDIPQAMITQAAAANRKLEFKLTLGQRGNNNNNGGWFLDDISVKASPAAMVNPVITMRAFPDLMNYPSSRGAKVVADITTTVTQGLCNDSIYLLYTIGSDLTPIRLTMSPVTGHAGRYEARIPFCGYDTLMRFHMYAKDNSTNHNAAGYPNSDDVWVTYKCVRGAANMSELSSSLSNGSDFPFPANGDAKSEFVYDSAILADAGYKPGAITSFAFNIAAAGSMQTRENMTVYMSNVDNSYTTSTTGTFYSGSLCPVFEGNYSMPAVGANTVQTFALQDTFFYAGGAILMRFINNNGTANPAATTLKVFPTATGKATIYQAYSALVGYNTYTDPEFEYGMTETKRPHFIFNAKANVPLLYDCGVSMITMPSPTNAAQANTNQQVKAYLKNYGALPINAVQISYRLDNGTPVHYNWTGSLNAGDSTLVTLSTTQQYTAGYHTITAWVEDTVTRSGQHYRDHEPYNDTAVTAFIACSGPLSGVRQIGGTGADYGTIEEFLFGLSSCGIDNVLTVKLAPGSYDPFTMPTVSGLTTAHYIQFEPLTDSGTVIIRNSGSSATSLVNMQAVANVRFHNIVFQAQENGLNELVKLGTSSANCKFLQCGFEAVAGVTVPKLFNSGAASSITIDGCSFYRGTTGVDLSGVASDNRSQNNIVTNCYFENQSDNAIRAVNQTGVTIQKNYMNDVTTNASYIVLLQHCYGNSKVVQNSIYSTHGASCLGMTDMHGTSSQYVIIANNMIVSADDGTSNMLTTALNVIGCDFTKVVYNTVKMNSPDKTGIAAATFGGASISNSWFVDNFVACMDQSNYAFSYIPGTYTSNKVHHNAYYSASAVLNRLSGANHTTLASWQAAVAMDSTSRVVVPGFIEATPVDLRTYNTAIKGWGQPITEVTVDRFDTVRNAVGPCVGAFEFDALHYDFSIVEMITPIDEYCDAPDSIEVVLRIQNSGINQYVPNTTSTIPMMVSCGNQNLMFNVSDTLVANGESIYHTGRYLSLQPNGTRDSIYNIRVTISAPFDPNHTNDTAFFTVRSNYHGAAVPSFTHNSNYAAAATIPVTTGVDQWNTHIYNSGRKGKSTIYWYADSLASDPIFRGTPLVTDPLFADTSFYIEQRRELEMVRISEVMISRTAPGATNPLPSWMNTSTTFAVELTNVGDYPAHVSGDTVQIVSNNNSYNNKYFILPDVVIQPGDCFVLQFRNVTANPNPSRTAFWTANLSPTNAINFAVLYRDGHGIQDAVLLNAIASQTQYSSLNVPQYVWKGAGITLPTGNNTTAGVKRTGWPTNPTNTISNSANYWTVADATHVMHVGTPEAELQQYQSNGCPGDRSKVNIHLLNVPTVDIALDSLEVNEGCGLDNELVSVTVHNYGTQTTPSAVSVVLKNGNTTVVTDNIPAMAAGAMVHHTFTVAVPMRANSDTTFNLKAYVNIVTGEFNTSNDTTRRSVTSLYSPHPPTVTSPVSLTYGQRDTLVATPYATRDTLVWFDANMNPLDTGATFITPILYDTTIYYVRAYGTRPESYHVGTLASQSAATAYPCPYNPKNNNAHEQYIYTAADLRAAGHSAGPITALYFYLDTIPTAAGMATFNQYKISIGTVADTFFSAANAWKTTPTIVYNQATTVRNSTKGWIRHEFNNPFQWDGQSSIVVNFERTINSPITQGARTRYTQTVQNSVLYKADNTGATGNGSLSKNRPDAMFEFANLGCPDFVSAGTGVGGGGDSIAKVQVNVGNIPPVDAALSWPDSGGVFTSCGTSNIDVVLENRGSSTMSNYTIDCFIDGVNHPYTTGAPLAAHSTQTVTIATNHFTPGRHSVLIIAHATGDIVTTNDTLSTAINARFCPGTYTIGTGCDYPNFTVAIDSLNNAGVDGHIIFNVATGTYNEQIVLSDVEGMGAAASVTFQAASGNPVDVKLRGAPTQANNYVLKITDQANHYNFKNFTIYSAPSVTTLGNAVVMDNATNLFFDSMVVKVKGTINNANASCFVVGGGVHNLSIINSTIDSGYYSVKAIMPTGDTATNFYFTDNQFRGFWFQGVTLRRVNDITFLRNDILGGVTAIGRALTGLWIAESNEAFDVEKNHIYIVDTKNGGKRGIQVTKCTATNLLRSRIYNNMVSVSGTGISGQASSGIWIDSTSSYVNVYFNSVRLDAGATAATTHAMHVGTGCAHNFVINNIFSNFSQGYAYYVMNDTNITTSNYNVYYGNSTAAVPKFAYWGAEASTLAALQAANAQDANSLSEQPYFEDINDLHATIGQFSEKAQYNPEVTEDIDGNIRPQIPVPTIGAHEYTRVNHDMALVAILEPIMPATATTVNNIETDPVKVKVRIFNNGNAVETNVRWRAEIVGVTGTLSAWKTIPGSINPSQFVEDSLYITPALGVIDTHYVKAWVALAEGTPGVGDTVNANDTLDSKFVLSPAFNLKGVAVSTDDGCELRNAEITLTIQNVGLKPIPANLPFTISYTATMKTAGANVSNLPINVTETVSLTEPLDINAPYTFTFTQHANLYPTNLNNKIQINLQGSVRLSYDLKTANDQTPVKVVNSYYTPVPPVGEDFYPPYATWGTIHATHQYSRVIHWYEDSTSDFFYNGTNNYARSTAWETPQYFADEVYYLNCFSHDGGNCPSHFAPVHVYVQPRVATDVAVEQVLQPWDKVYMIEDNVQVRIINYGTSAVSNIPVTFQLLNANGTQLLQTATETCTATIAPGATYDFMFDSMLHINTPTTNTTYKIRAWTDLATDEVHLNDTIRYLYEFHSLPPSTYCTPAVDAAEGMDITRFSYNTIYQEMPSSGFKYMDFGVYPNPEVPILHLQRGATDTMTVECVNNSNDIDYETRARFTAYLDLNRDGVFTANERAVTFITMANSKHSMVYTVPATASLGLMKMRIILDGDTMNFYDPCVNTSNGQIQDYLVSIDDVAKNGPRRDVALARIAQPANFILSVDTTAIGITFVNKGSEQIDSIHFTYSYTYMDGYDTTVFNGQKNWTGTLAPGGTGCIMLPRRYFGPGTTVFNIQCTVNGDEDVTNNSLEREFHRFHEKTLVYTDNFDDGNFWYAPHGYNNYTRNYWQLGVPNKTRLYTAYSDPNVWATDLVSTITSGTYGNTSYLYSPIFDISQIHPDTLSFRMACNMPEGSKMVIEYRNFESSWQVIQHSDITNNWFNGDNCFSGNTSNYGYREFYFPLARIGGEFPQRLQFRIKYTTERGTSANASYGDGLVIDNFRIGRAQRSVDVGVIALTQPTAPQFGQTVYPQVIIKNYGYDTIRQVRVGYIPYGSVLSREGTYEGAIAPGGTDYYTFTNSFIVTNDFPDTFSICAFTCVNTDIYRDNDTICQNFYLSPLENDMSAVQFVSPLQNVVAGDSVAVTLRLRNYGRQRIHQARLTYVFNSTITVTEDVNLDDYLGVGGLESFEYFNYTFHQKFRAAMGTMTLTGYCKFNADTYPLNDTTTMRFYGISAIADLQAREIVFDQTNQNVKRVQLIIANVGARGANDFEVGFWIDNDSTTKVVERYNHAEPIPALSIGYHIFTPLPEREAPYTYITAYVHNLEDNDRSNDTTTFITDPYVDIQVNKLIVEENMYDECHVRMEVVNLGNMTLVFKSPIKATINGESLSDMSEVELEPGVVHRLDFSGTIHKDPNRHYTGSGTLTNGRDVNTANNSTSIVEVQNYFEGVPTVSSVDGIVLNQNFPNPFESSTRIEFTIPTASDVRFFVMDELGRLLHQSVNSYGPGDHSINFSQPLTSGVYYYGIEVNGQRLMRKMVYKN